MGVFFRSAAGQEKRRRTQEEREALKNEAVNSLPEGYFQEEFDPPLFELQGMPPNFQVPASLSILATISDIVTCGQL